MCLIIERQPNISIDKKAFEIAVMNNPDGYGLVVSNGDGTCYVEKELDYDTDDLYKTIDDTFGNDTIMLHLRYTTAGATTRRNLHPFPILEYEADGVDLWMAHNGTLSDWKHPKNTKNDWESDTRHFVRRYVRPLFKRLIKGMNIEDILSDPFVYELLDKELTSMSVLSFIDGFGNTLQVNGLGNGGKYEEGMWYSNEYSFDAGHRDYGTGTNKQWQSTYYQDYNDEAYADWWASRSGRTIETSSTTNKDHAEDTMQNSFTERFGIEEDDLFQLTDDTLEAMLKDEPDALLDLSKELLHLLYEAKIEVGKLQIKKNKAEELIAEMKKEQEDASESA